MSKKTAGYAAVMHAILIWFDHLPYALPGCCGNTEAQTPGFDRFAAGSVTFDNCFVEDRRTDGAAGLIATLRRLRVSGASVRVLAVHSTHLVGMLRQGIDEDAASAIDVEMLDDDDQMSQRLIDAVESLSGSRAGSDGDPPCVVTVAAMPGVVTPEGEVIDELLESADHLLERLAIVPTSGQRLLLVTAGAGHTSADHGSELNERLIHVPLLGRIGPAQEFGVHSPSLVTRSDVANALLSWAGVAADLEPSRDMVHAAALLQELTGSPQASRGLSILRGLDRQIGVRTRKWYLTTRMPEVGEPDALMRASDSAALYQKPDDLWDSLDMASQLPAVVEELVSMLPVDGGKSGEVPEKHR